MNIVYNASAGTGKTFQVTQLFEKLVMEEGINPREILLMTFTDNAAAELRMRVAQRLLTARRTAEAEGNDEQTECAINALSQLPSAPIGTIHSFCTRLLREHALDAGLSPGFSVLVGDAHANLLDQICRDELLKRLDTDPDFKTFCAGAHIIGTGGGFGTSITETVPNLISQAGSLGISLENAEAMLPDPVSTATRIDFEIICNRIQELPKITPAVAIALKIIQQGLQETNDVETLVARMNELGIKKFGRGGAKEVSGDFWALKEAVEDAVKYRTRHPAAKAFARYLQSVALQFQQHKHEMDAVDFNDQLQMAEALLSSGKANPNFKYVIVDEVQDTSRIQCQLIQSLWGDETNLVICGDKKQSIYTWRGADPQVMPDLEKAILTRENSELINLQISYRSKAPILDVVNTLFESVYGEKEYSEGDRLKPNSDFKTADEKPCVEFLTFDGDSDCPKPEKVTAEMEAVAHRIQLLINGSSEWKPSFRYAETFEPTDGKNSFCYSDVLILLKRTTHQSALEQALRHAGVPYTLGGKGRGLFARQETRDVSLFLNVLTNPNDAFSLVGFLRSPWVGLSDETIAELAWSEGGFSAENLLAYFSLKNKVTENCTIVQRSVTSWQDTVPRYRELLGTRLASELVRLLIEETGYDALLAGLPRGTQRLANLRKVLDWLRETERGAQTTPAAVARKLDEHISNPPNTPEAALLDPAQNAVTIMTVHGSKGLTKRVVFVPDISFSSNAEKGFASVFSDEQNRPGLGLRITAPDKSNVMSPGFKEANERAKNVRAHELKNLFYVALTRARDLVVTSASIGTYSAGWYKEIESLLGETIPTISYSKINAAAERAEPAEIQRPTHDRLTTALESLPLPPHAPKLQRIPVTRLAKEGVTIKGIPLQHATTTALGSLGHAVLEQLALNNWQGSIGDWLERLCRDFSIEKAEATTLENRIEKTRELMIERTAKMQEIHPEFSFVLHQDDKLIDGTVDLLCRTSDGFSFFDYKFTEAEDAAVAEQYREQMQLYQKAAEKRYPTANEALAHLVVISQTGPRLIPIDF